MHKRGVLVQKKEYLSILKHLFELVFCSLDHLFWKVL